MALPSIPVAPTTRVETPTRDAPGVVTQRHTSRVAVHVRHSLIVLVLCAAVATAAYWVYRGVEQSLRDLREQGLPALLEATTKLLEAFIAELSPDAERWAWATMRCRRL